MQNPLQNLDNLTSFLRSTVASTPKQPRRNFAVDNFLEPGMAGSLSDRELGPASRNLPAPSPVAPGSCNQSTAKIIPRRRTEIAGKQLAAAGVCPSPDRKIAAQLRRRSRRQAERRMTPDYSAFTTGSAFGATGSATETNAPVTASWRGCTRGLAPLDVGIEGPGAVARPSR
jgi:hypothetical protein